MDQKDLSSKVSDSEQTLTVPKVGNKQEARFIQVKKGTRIFSKGDDRDYAYLIDIGEIHIYETDEDGANKENNGEPACKLKAGEIFGEMALIEEGPRTASAICATDVNLLVISPAMLQERIAGMDPIVGLLISLLVDRYRQARLNIYEDVSADSSRKMMDKSLLTPLPVSSIKSSVRDMIKHPENALNELKVEQELRQAVEEKQFFPVLQPIFRLRDKSIAGFEALIRWNHPTKGVVPPNDFIPVAERTGVIQSMDRLMLDFIADITPKVNEIAGDKNGNIYIGVNLSGVNFENMDVVEGVANICAREDVLPHQIRLEITESAFISEPEMAESVLSALKALGVSIALDDFGTGFSSLNYLHKFSIDTLKIDRTFVQQLHTQSKSLDIVRAIVGLAQTFRMDVVAEGIENEDEILALAGVGCENGQGFLFSKPVSVDEAYKMIEGKARK